MKKVKLIILAVSLFILTIKAFGQINSKVQTNKNKENRIEQEILRLEEKGRQKALNGESNWDDLMAQGAYLIQGDGSIMIYQKGQNLASLPLKSFKLSELIARDLGETVIVTGLSEVESETPQKQPFSFQMRYLNVWKKVNDQWKIIISERTMVRPYGK